MKNFLAPLILIISFDASSAFDRWEEANFKPLMAGEILPGFDKNELYIASSEPAQIQQSRVIKGLKVEKIIDGDRGTYPDSSCCDGYSVGVDT